MMRIFIGYDPVESVAYHVLSHSILSRSSIPVSITPINKRNIPEFTRGMEDGSTEFSFSRFLTPYLAGYEGYAVFMDCDMLVMCDIAELLPFCSDSAVSVVQHDYEPKPGMKFLGNVQHVYPRKNWSSLMVFNCGKCRDLSPEVVNTASGAFLHRLEWAGSVDSIPVEYNHLVGEYDENPNAKIAHFTLGTPCFKGYENQEYADEWFNELRQAMSGMDDLLGG